MGLASRWFVRLARLLRAGGREGSGTRGLVVTRGVFGAARKETGVTMQQARSVSEFKVGDKAVYPAQGVAEVVSIEERDIAGARQRFYVLRILDSDRKIMVPVKNAETVGLRSVICEEEIREIFEILRERTVAFDNQTWNRR